MSSVATEKPKRNPLPLGATGTLGQAVEEHVARRLAELGIIPKASIPSPVREEAVGQQVQEHLTVAESQDEVLQEALNNQQYYLEQARATGKPWFQCPRYRRQYSEHVFITVAMAEELMRFNNNIRQLDEALVTLYARDLATGRWLQTGECIEIDVAGWMIDGQHRASGIIKSNKAYILYVTWNVPAIARMVLDSGAKRTLAKKMKFIDGDTAGLGNRIAAVVRGMMMGSTYRSTRFSESEVWQFRLAFDSTLKWVAKHCAGKRADVQAAVAKAYLWHGEEAILPFCDKLHRCIFPTADDPVGVLYRFLQRSSQSKSRVPGEVVYRKTVAAINHFLAGRKVERLFDEKNDFFEWAAGWKIPANAPALNKK